MSEIKKLTRSRNNRMIAGVCAGIASYFDIDPTIVRLVFVAFALLGGPGFIAYIVALILMPIEPVKASAASVVEVQEYPKVD